MHSLAGQRVVNGSQICGGMDAEDPTCGRIHLSGRLVALAKLTDIARAEASLGTRHPNAAWLAQGGAHTGGKYYTLELTSIMFLDMYGVNTWTSRLRACIETLKRTCVC